MEIKAKRIVAREFLILTAISFLSSLYFLGIFIYDGYLQFRIHGIKNQIEVHESLLDSISEKFNLKIKNKNEFIIAFSKEVNFEIPDQNYIDTNWQMLEDAYREKKVHSKFDEWKEQRVVDFLKSHGYYNENIFWAFIGENILNRKDSINITKSIILENSIKELSYESSIFKNKIVYSNEQINITLYIFTILFSLAFPLRYIFYGIQWSINIIKLPNEI